MVELASAGRAGQPGSSAGSDETRTQDGVHLTSTGAGLLATAWFYRWSHRPERAGLARRIDESTTGGSLRRAQAALDDIARFADE